MFRCNQCSKTFEDHSAIRRHLSIKHFNYFPFICKICKKMGENHTTATEEDMDKHISAIHQGSDYNITLSRDKVIEVKINAVVEECRLPASQSISREFKSNLHNGSNAPNDRSLFRATAIENEPISSHVEQTNGETTEIAAEDDIEIVFESVPQKVKDEITTPTDISLGLKNALHRAYDILCNETTVGTAAKEVECFSSEIKQELGNNEATGNITADKNDGYNRKMTVQRELLENSSELRTKDLGGSCLTGESNSCANSITCEIRDAPIFALPELQTLQETPIISSDTQSQDRLNSVALSDETFNQIDEEDIRQDSIPNGQNRAMPLPSVEENLFQTEQNTDEELNEHDATEPAIQTQSSSNKSAANLIQRKRTLPINDRHSRKKLSSKRSNHKKTNGTEKLYKCDHCSYASAKKCNVVHHMRTHTGEKPFKCDHCTFACSHKSNLTIHVRNHTGEKPFKCRVCSFASATSSVLNVHVRTHIGEKPFKCNRCSFACSHKSGLNVHIRTGFKHLEAQTMARHKYHFVYSKLMPKSPEKKKAVIKSPEKKLNAKPKRKMNTLKVAIKRALKQHSPLCKFSKLKVLKAGLVYMLKAMKLKFSTRNLQKAMRLILPGEIESNAIAHGIKCREKHLESKKNQ